MIALSIGNFNFDQWEVPEEIDGLGASLAMVQHSFPGGITSVQTFGAFSNRRISWSGHFLEDQKVPIKGRITALQQMVYDQQQVTLQFGDFSYLVMVRNVTFKPKLEWWVPYSIELFGVEDPTAQQSGNGSGQTASSTTQNPTIGDFNTAGSNIASNAANAQAAAAQSGSSFQQTALTSFQQSLKNALVGSVGNPANVANASLNSAIAAAQAELAPYVTSSDPLAIAYSTTMSDQLGALSVALNPPIPNILQPLQNPDLQQLALIYYGDADQWTKIAKANDMLIPNPVGQFSLKIPVS